MPVLQTSAAEVEEARLKLQQAQAAAEAGSAPLHYVSNHVAYISHVPDVACFFTQVNMQFLYIQYPMVL